MCTSLSCHSRLVSLCLARPLAPLTSIFYSTRAGGKSVWTDSPIVKHALYQSTAAPEYGAWWRTASRPSCVHLFRVIVVSCHCVWLALSRCDCCPCVLTCMCSGQCLQIEISASDRPSLQIDARLDFLTISGRFFSSKVLLGLYVMSLAKPSLHFCRDRTVLPRAQSLVACVRLSE